MKISKRFILMLSLVLTALMLTACGKQELVGCDKVEALRSAAEGYESASYIITNLTSGEVEQTFTFMYNPDGTQTYYCEGYDTEGYYAEYSNGRELFRERDGVGSAVSSDADDYVSYTKKKPHPYSTGQLFFYINGYVSSAEESTDDEGNTLYIYHYDTERLNKDMKTNMDAFATSYAFDGEGNFVYFRQTNSGSDGSYAYEITLENVNGITSIDNPITIGSQTTE